MFDNNSFQDFTKSKMDQILQNPEFPEPEPLKDTSTSHPKPQPLASKSPSKRSKNPKSPPIPRSNTVQPEKWVSSPPVPSSPTGKDLPETLKIICNTQHLSQPSIGSKIPSLLSHPASPDAQSSSSPSIAQEEAEGNEVDFFQDTMELIKEDFQKYAEGDLESSQEESESGFTFQPKLGRENSKEEDSKESEQLITESPEKDLIVPDLVTVQDKNEI